MNALVGEEGDLILDSECDGEPVKRFHDGGDVIMFVHPHQDPGSGVLDVLESLDALARNPDEESITVVQPGGDKGVDELLCICQGECWTEFSNVPEVVERCLTNTG